MILVQHADITDAGVVDVLRDTKADVLCTDPPYSSLVHSKAVSNRTGGAGVRKRDLGFASVSTMLIDAIASIAASVTRWSIVFSDIESTHLWRASMPVRYVRALPWVRWSQPQLSGDRPPSGCEMINLFHSRCKMVNLFHPKTAPHWSGPGSLTMFDAKSLRGGGKYSCEKPLDLMLSLVSYFSDRGELVLDPCCGSGTTGLACRLLERDAVLIDCDADACEIAQRKCDSSLSDRDRERCMRWIDYQDAWLAGEAPSTKSGQARYARALADTALIRDTIA